MSVRYIRVKTDTSALTPVATHSFGNVAILGPIISSVGTAAVTGNPGNQTVTLTPSASGFPTGSNFTIGFGGQTTAAIPVTAAGSDVQTALVALSSVGSDAGTHAPNAKVTGGAGGPYVVALQGTLAQNPTALTATSPVSGLPAGVTDNAASVVQVNIPEPFSDPGTVAQRCPGPLGASIQRAFMQTPGPALIYAVRTPPAPQATDWQAALDAVKTANVQLVVLAMVPLDSGGGALNNDGSPAGPIARLASHVATVSQAGDGLERMGVAMLAKDATDTSVAQNSVLKSDRMVYIAHRSTEDVASAVAGVIAGYQPQVSILLKPVKIDSSPFSPADIDIINETQPGKQIETDDLPPQGAGVNWLTQTPLIPGGATYMGEGYTGDPSGGIKWIDIRRTIDDINFRLKARLISSIGNLRLNRADLRTMVGMFESVLVPLVNNNVIDRFQIQVRLLDLLDKDPATLTASEQGEISDARNNRQARTTVVIVYAGAIHRLNLSLKLNSV